MSLNVGYAPLNTLRVSAVILLLAVSVPLVHAHPFTLETGTGIQDGDITSVWVTYSEAIEVSFSSLRVYDGDGNQIDLKNTAHYTDEKSLVVDTPPLSDGVYTLASKVLSKVDGHLVPDTILFTVGDVMISPGAEAAERDLVLLPEAGSRFLGYVGQSILVGAIVSTLLVWGLHSRIQRDGADQIRTRHNDTLATLTGLSLIGIFASNILILVVYAVRLESFTLDILQTSFGTLWIARMALTLAALGVWFVLNHNRKQDRRILVSLLALGLLIMTTYSQMGHGAATGETLPVVLDFVHALVSAVWIGGVIYLCVVAVPALAVSSSRDDILLLLIPRFSSIVIIGLALVIVSGPLLLWSLESSVSAITGSLYGQLIVVKVVIAGAMVSLGGYNGMLARRRISHGTPLYDKVRRMLIPETALGIALLAVVALLVNGTLPAGELGDTEYLEAAGIGMAEFAGNTRFAIELEPYTTGLNAMYVRTTDLQGEPVAGEIGVQVKISNPERNISPVSIPLEPITLDGAPAYAGEVTFGFAGNWVVEIESQREQVANELVTLILPIKPDMDAMVVDITEYPLPEAALPLSPVYDGAGSIWISDALSPRLWKFDTQSREFESFGFEGEISLFLTMDAQGRIWFTDPRAGQIGYLDTANGEFTIIEIPSLEPVSVDSVMTLLREDGDGRIWVAVPTKDSLLRYDPGADSFDVYALAPGAFPFALAPDDAGRMWFTADGRIGYVEPATGNMEEFAPDIPLRSPEYIFFDNQNRMWISEHTGAALNRFDTATFDFERIPISVEEGLPYGIVQDKYGYLWIAQHTVDEVVVYDPDEGRQRSIPLPMNNSFVQFAVTDGSGDVWLVGQQSNSIALVDITDIPSAEAPMRPETGTALRYTEIVSPLVAAGILGASLFFVRSVYDARAARGKLEGQ